MEAYILAIIGEGKDTKIRVLDLTPDIRNNILVVPIERFKDVVINGSGMPNVMVHGDIITFCDTAIENCFPLVKSEKSTSKKISVIKTIYRDNGEHEVIIANCQGKIAKITMAELANTYSKYITNARFVRASISGMFPTTKIKGAQYKLCYPNGLVVESVGIPKHIIEQPTYRKVVGPEDKAGDKLFDEWIDTEYFVSEMTSRRLKHSITDYSTSLNELDPKVPVINVPVGITNIGNLFYAQDEAELAYIEKVRIPNTVTNIKRNAFEYVNNIKRVEYQFRDGNGYLNAEGLDTIMNSPERRYIPWLLPTDLEKLTGFAYRVEACSADLACMHNLKLLSSSFNENRAVYDDIILPLNVTDIRQSFRYSDFCDLDGKRREATLTIPPNVVEISSSFSHCNIFEIDFSKAVSLERISWYSFEDIDIKKLDLSGCVKLEYIDSSFKNLQSLEEVILPANIKSISGDSFSNCPNLKNVVLPQGIENVRYGCFNSTAIEEIRIPSSCLSTPSIKDCTIRFDEREQIGQDLLNSVFGFKQVIFEGNLQEIGHRAFSGKTFKNYVIPDTVKFIGSQAFEDSIGEIIDMYEWKATRIPYRCFATCRLKTIILPRDTTAIDEEAFYKSTAIQKIFIPESVKSIEKGALTQCGAGINGGTEFFVVAGSFAEKYLTKQKKRVSSFEDDYEAYMAITGQINTSSAAAQSKAKLLLANSNDVVTKEFLKPEYIGNVQTLMNIHKLTKTQFEPNEVNIPLLTPRLRKLYPAKVIGDFIHNINDDISKDNIGDLVYCSNDSQNFSKLTNQFKLLCNLISGFSEPVSFLYKQENMIKFLESIYSDDKLKDSAHIAEVYLDEYSGIFIYHTRINSGDKSTPISLILVIIEGNVVYIAADRRSANRKPVKAFKEVALPYGVNFDDYADLHKNVNFSLRKILSVGDFIEVRQSRATKLQGVLVTRALASTVLNEMYKHMIVAGAYDSAKESRLCLVDILDGTLYRCTANPIGDTALKDLGDVNYLNIVAIEPFGSWSQPSCKLIKQSFIVSYDTIDLINQWLNKGNTIKELLSNPDAYDDFAPCGEWLLAQALSEANITGIDKLNKKSISLILNTAFFSKVRKKTEDVKDMQNYTSITLSDGARLVTVLPNRKASASVIGFESKFYSYLEIPGEPMEENIDTYVSSSYPISVFDSICKLYDPNKKSYKYITDEQVDITDFTKVWTSNVTYDRWNIHLLVNRASGGIYLGCSSYFSKAVIITRFTNMENALKFTNMVFKDGEAIQRRNVKPPIYGLNTAIVEYAMHNSNNPNKCNNIIKSLVDAIKSGHPNGYKFAGDLGILFELCAKQRVNP